MAIFEQIKASQADLHQMRLLISEFLSVTILKLPVLKNTNLILSSDIFIDLPNLEEFKF